MLFGSRDKRDRVDLGFAVFEFTDACNQACRFCYNYFKGDAGPCAVAPPDYRFARRTLKRLLRQANIGSISFSGGEPMLMPKIHDLALMARFRGANVNLLTNGTLLTDNDIAIFNDIGLGKIQIPILADRAELHDHITQLAGSWDRAMRAARRVAATKQDWLMPVFILSRLNVDRIEPALELYSELGASYIMCNRFNIGGLGKYHAEELNLSHEELRDAFRRVDVKASELGMRVHSGVCTPMCLLDPKDYPNIMFSHCSTDIAQRPLTINYRGEVRFCNHSPRVLGNIYDESLADIIARANDDGYFTTTPDRCVGCKLWTRCRGGCRAAAEQLYGTFDRVDPVMDLK